MLRRLSIIFLLSCFLLPSVCLAVSVSQSLDRTEIPFEEAVHLRIEISWPGAPTAYLFQKALRINADRLKVASLSSTVTSSGAGADETTTKVLDYTLRPTAPGLATIDATTIEYLVWPDSVAGELITDPMTVTVAEPVPVKETGGDGPSTGLVVIIVVLVLAAAGVVVFILRRRRPREVSRTPGELFLDNLARLKLEAGSDLKAFQTGLYKLLAEYLSARYAIDIEGKSAETVLGELEQAGMSLQAREKIGGWLTRAEKEKYAPVTAAPGDVIRLESEIREFFEKTQ